MFSTAKLNVWDVCHHFKQVWVFHSRGAEGFTLDGSCHVQQYDENVQCSVGDPSHWPVAEEMLNHQPKQPQAMRRSGGGLHLDQHLSTTCVGFQMERASPSLGGVIRNSLCFANCKSAHEEAADVCWVTHARKRSSRCSTAVSPVGTLSLQHLSGRRRLDSQRSDLLLLSLEANTLASTLWTLLDLT